jgi:hypothetical protein
MRTTIVLKTKKVTIPTTLSTITVAAILAVESPLLLAEITLEASAGRKLGSRKE